MTGDKEKMNKNEELLSEDYSVRLIFRTFKTSYFSQWLETHSRHNKDFT